MFKGVYWWWKMGKLYFLCIFLLLLSTLSGSVLGNDVVHFPNKEYFQNSMKDIGLEVIRDLDHGEREEAPSDEESTNTETEGQEEERNQFLFGLYIGYHQADIVRQQHLDLDGTSGVLYSEGKNFTPSFKYVNHQIFILTPLSYYFLFYDKILGNFESVVHLKKYSKWNNGEININLFLDQGNYSKTSVGINMIHGYSFGMKFNDIISVNYANRMSVTTFLLDDYQNMSPEVYNGQLSNKFTIQFLVKNYFFKIYFSNIMNNYILSTTVPIELLEHGNFFFTPNDISAGISIVHWQKSKKDIIFGVQFNFDFLYHSLLQYVDGNFVFYKNKMFNFSVSHIFTALFNDSFRLVQYLYVNGGMNSLDVKYCVAQSSIMTMSECKNSYFMSLGFRFSGTTDISPYISVLKNLGVELKWDFKYVTPEIFYARFIIFNFGIGLRYSE